MADVNEVIEALGCLATNQHKCGNCPYNPHPGMDWVYGCMAGQGKIVDDARALLRRIVPHVLTLDEATEADVCWLELIGARRIIPCNVHVFSKSITATIFKLNNGPEDLFLDEYGISWRCWSNAPSSKQRREEPWHERFPALRG